MFDYFVLIFIIAITLLIFGNRFFKKDLFTNVYFGIIICSILLYVGVGGALIEVDRQYVLYYCGYLVSIWLGFRLFPKYDNKSIDENVYNLFINRYAKLIIIIYVFLCFADLLYPQIKLVNLINPPALDLKKAFLQRFEQHEISIIEIISLTIRNFLEPFFYFSLYYYKKHVWKIGVVLFLVMYFNYCKIGYIGRGQVMTNLIVFFVLAYIWKPVWRKKIILGIICGTPFLFVFLVNYASIRIGGSIKDISFSQATEMLFLGESNYPLWFNDISIRNNSLQDICDYVYWLVTLPLPVSPGLLGFDVGTNYKISEYLLGISRGEEGFYVLLPGLVGEAYYIFGKLFWIHGSIYGCIIGGTYNYFIGKDSLLPLGLFVAMTVGYACARGGTPAAYPMIIKQLLYFVLVFRLYSKYPLRFVIR